MINLNKKEMLFVGRFEFGRTQNIEVKLGRKLYLVDIDKSSHNTSIDFYKKQGPDRGTYSKYGVEDSVLGVEVKNDAMLDRSFFEHIKEIYDAQRIYSKFSSILYK